MHTNSASFPYQHHYLSPLVNSVSKTFSGAPKIIRYYQFLPHNHYSSPKVERILAGVAPFWPSGKHQNRLEEIAVKLFGKTKKNIVDRFND
jgi:hypothetical protein